jgi:hypothetical protein
MTTKTISFTVKKSKIAENGDYNLTGDRYREVIDYSNTKWEMVELGEVLEYEQPTNYLVESVNYSDEYKTPVLTAGKSFLLGYTNEVNGIFPTANLPVIIFDDFTTATKFVDFPFKVKSSAMKILKSKNNVNISYVFYMMQKINFDASQHKRYWISQYSKIQIPLPPLEIQEQIVAEIEQYQKVAGGAKQVVENWKPSFRIDPSWEMVELGEVCEVNKETLDIVEDLEYQYIDISSVENETGKIVFGDRILGKTLPSRAKRKVAVGDVLLSTVRPNLKAFAKIDELPINSVASTGFAVLTPKESLKSGWIYQLLFTDLLQDQMIGQMGKGAYPSINSNDVKNLKIPLPPLEVQEQIVAEIEAEQKAIEECKKLIEKMEKKVEAKIGEVWGDEV